ncbi:hypothetical protein LCGC14_3122080 [marine sediment metagenome]|uniref:Uncharacterized protein n=1 Tax=marine sediment metagenome TaxID=412755 RepID=A0A0F8Y9F3_9ZZZZ|nr:hypothetical protein [bacterium]
MKILLILSCLLIMCGCGKEREELFVIQDSSFLDWGDVEETPFVVIDSPYSSEITTALLSAIFTKPIDFEMVAFLKEMAIYEAGEDTIIIAFGDGSEITINLTKGGD